MYVTIVYGYVSDSAGISSFFLLVEGRCVEGFVTGSAMVIAAVAVCADPLLPAPAPQIGIGLVWFSVDSSVMSSIGATCRKYNVHVRVLTTVY